MEENKIWGEDCQSKDVEIQQPKREARDTETARQNRVAEIDDRAEAFRHQLEAANGEKRGLEDRLQAQERELQGWRESKTGRKRTKCKD